MDYPNRCETMIRTVLSNYGNVPGIALAIAASTEFQTAVARGLEKYSAFGLAELTLEQCIRLELAELFDAQTSAADA